MMNDVNEYLLGTEYDISTSFVDASRNYIWRRSQARFDNDGDRLYVVVSDETKLINIVSNWFWYINNTGSFYSQSLRTNTITLEVSHLTMTELNCM